MTNKECMKGGVTGVVLFFVFWGTCWALTSQFLMDYYIATENLWRPVTDMATYGPYALGYMLLIALIFASLFRKWRATVPAGVTGTCSCNWRKSIRFGLVFGLIIGLTSASAYAFLPIPAGLAIGWLLIDLIKGALGGIVAEFLWRKL